MRIIKANSIKEAVSMLCIKANIDLRADVYSSLEKALRIETKSRAKNIIRDLLRNADIAKIQRLPICQDTGMAVVFVELGQNIFVSGDLNKAINDGVKLGYKRGFLRKSVALPLTRKNTSDNAPAVIHYKIVPNSSKIKITVFPKGFGCENKSRTKMLNPSDGIKEIAEFVVETVKLAGPDACPPYIVGVGIGGTADKSALLAKEALLKTVNKITKIENDLLRKINKLNIGPMGLGGKATALAVKVLVYPTHIAGLPVSVNISCHALRSATTII